MECVEKCPYKETIDNLKKDSEKNADSISIIKDVQSEMRADIRVLGKDVSSTLELVKSVQADTSELKTKPSKNLNIIFNTVVAGSIMVVAAAVITAIIKLL